MDTNEIDATVFMIDRELDTLDNAVLDSYEHHASYKNSQAVSQILGGGSHVVGGEPRLLSDHDLDALRAVDSHDWMD